MSDEHKKEPVAENFELITKKKPLKKKGAIVVPKEEGEEK